MKPVGLDCCYYYPYGTTQNLSHSGEFLQYQPKHDHHVLFHWDQEPLYSTDLGCLYDNQPHFFSAKVCKLFATSERSQITKQVCAERDMLNWYYFYHGFASADWFSDAQYIDIENSFTKVFSSLNHIVTHKRSYRMAMVARLLQACLVDFGDISFHGTQRDCAEELDDPHTELSDRDKILIDEIFCQGRVALPLLVDQSCIDGSFSAKFGHQEYKLLQNSFMHLVNETVFYDNKLHLTEKIFKPIIALRPFILVAAPGNLAYLKSYGFRTFDTWIDEEYDLIQDYDTRLEFIVKQVEQLCALSSRQLQNLYLDMQDTLKFNKQHFFGNFQDIIVNELVENFDTCIRIWNHGRLDSTRVLPRQYDIDLVKRILRGKVIAGI